MDSWIFFGFAQENYVMKLTMNKTIQKPKPATLLFQVVLGTTNILQFFFLFFAAILKTIKTNVKSYKMNLKLKRTWLS